MNILGNQDGQNLADPDKAAMKLANKTELLEEILGYPVGERYGVSSHKVRIDYYPPRGDAKEAWDVIDFLGLFGLPMSLRINLLARDSVLAAPLAHLPQLRKSKRVNTDSYDGNGAFFCTTFSIILGRLGSGILIL